jgi:hypothetical protein
MAVFISGLVEFPAATSHSRHIHYFRDKTTPRRASAAWQIARAKASFPAIGCPSGNPAKLPATVPLASMAY